MARNKRLDFAGMVGKGENPNGFRAQTAAATEKDENGPPPQQWNWDGGADGERWNSWPRDDVDYPATIAPAPRRRRR